MRRILSLLTVLAACSPHPEHPPSAPAPIPADALGSPFASSADFRTLAYGTHRLEDAYLQLDLTDAGATVHLNSGDVHLITEGIGAAGQPQPLEWSEREEGDCLDQPTEDATCLRPVIRHAEGIEEWWLPNRDGAQQLWHVHTMPSGADSVTLRLLVDGAAVEATSTRAIFRPATGAPLYYDDLRAYDATGRALDARFVAQAGALDIQVDATDAELPLLIDPFISATRITIPRPDGVPDYRFGFSLASGRFNDDAFDDLAVGYQARPNPGGNHGRLYLYHGDATTLPTTPVGHRVGANGVAAVFDFVGEQTDAADFSGDGYDDLVLVARASVSAAASAVQIFPGGTTGIAESPDVDLRFPYNSVFSVSSGDFNGDGRADLAISTNSDVAIHYGSASGLSATASRTITPPSGASGNASIGASGDLNNDGFDDLVIAWPDSSGGGRAWAWLGRSGTLTASPNVAVPNPSNRGDMGHGIGFVGDTNGDGRGAVVLQSYNPGQAWIFQYGTSGFSSGVLLPVSVQQARGKRPRPLGDINGDGFDDFVVSGDASTTAVIMGGPSGFLPHISQREFQGRWAQATGDFNQDGKPDLALGDYTTNRTFVYPGCTDADADGYCAEIDDCDDNDPDVRPGVAEIPGDGIDQNCDGIEICYRDHDDDGWRVDTTVTTSTTTCVGPGLALTATPDGDCNDNNPDINPGATEIPGDGVDQNCDGQELCYQDGDSDLYRTDEPTLTPNIACAGGGFALATMPGGDCDDDDASINPGATEIPGDGIDQNCDGQELCFRDADEDLYRTDAPTLTPNIACAGGGFALATMPAGDCDDNNPDINPGAAEIPGDGIDQNCDGQELCFRDADEDLYRTDAPTLTPNIACAGGGFALATMPAGDCDDNNASVNPGATEIPGDGIDQDCDGLELCYQDGDGDLYRTDLTTLTPIISCIGEGLALAAMPSGDCDDNNASINPGATEIPGDGIDQDCDGLELCYQDGDGDLYRTDLTTVTTTISCIGTGLALATMPSGDCDDDDASVNPGATEIPGDGIDQNCDGQELCFRDADEDLYRTDAPTLTSNIACAGGGFALATMPAGDCDDNNPDINPGAAEIPGDGIDQDCDGQELCYQDGDSDLYRTDLTTLTPTISCTGEGLALATMPSGDCDDNDASVNPGATEIPGDGIDQDCDGQELCYQDGDGDLYRTDLTTPSPDLSCSGTGLASNTMPGGDCDDANAAINPGATEIPGDGVDQDCDGQELCYQDVDQDNFRVDLTTPSADLTCTTPGLAPASMPGDDCNDNDPTVYPGATEIPGDGIDQSCDGFELCYIDADEDGFRSTDTVLSTDLSCSAPGLAPASAPIDCDDNDPDVNGGSPEIPGDGIDQDCDGYELCFHDADADGYRTEDTTPSTDFTCLSPGLAPAVVPDGDCDDNNPSIHPGATELPGDGVDQDCDGFELCFVDDDDDGFHGDRTVLSDNLACDDEGTFDNTFPDGDCDDDDPSINPDATEIPDDGVDQDCDGFELCFVDADRDGYRMTLAQPSALLDCGGPDHVRSAVPDGDCNDNDPTVHPGAAELPGDGVDQNCDGLELCFQDADDDGLRVEDTELSPILSCEAEGIAPLDTPDGDCDDNNPDADGDGLMDGDEVILYGTDPCDPDSDGDGLNDGDEVLVHFTDPLDPDTDRGGVNDGDEVLNGTDPLDPSDDFPPPIIRIERDCGCATPTSPAGAAWIALLSLGYLRRRRRVA